MDVPPPDLDQARREVASRELVAEASGHLTTEVAAHLPFEGLVAFKNFLKRFFSAAPWTSDDAQRLSQLVMAHLPEEGWWEHDLDDGISMGHGVREGRYHLWVTGGAGPGSSIFDRVFDGPVVPEATPHPRKVKFNIGGSQGPGRWYRRGDEVEDNRVEVLLAESDVTDVMVAGDFVTVGLAKGASWEVRLDPILVVVTQQFYDESAPPSDPPERTRDELVGEGLRTGTPEELHLLDPDEPGHRVTLENALRHPDAEIRRLALATLAQSDNAQFVAELLAAAYEDRHRIVRRMAVDAGADLATESVRSLFERALRDDDAWVRWKAIRGLREIGVDPSRSAVEAMADDADFQVRFEAEAAVREVNAGD